MVRPTIPLIQLIQVDLEWLEGVSLVPVGGAQRADEGTVAALAVQTDEVDLLALVVLLGALHVLYYVAWHFRLHLIKDLIYNQWGFAGIGWEKDKDEEIK